MTPNTTPNWHLDLLEDLQELISEARKFQFHDFKNTKYAAPKAVLAMILQDLRENVINWRYDN